MEMSIRSVGRRALQARSLYSAAIILFACARNVNPCSDELIFNRRGFGDALARKSRDCGVCDDCTQPKYIHSLHERLLRKGSLLPNILPRAGLLMQCSTQSARSATKIAKWLIVEEAKSLDCLLSLGSRRGSRIRQASAH